MDIGNLVNCKYPYHFVIDIIIIRTRGYDHMRTRLAGFVFVLVFIMAMTYSGFMAWAQETTGQTAELPARPWWHCDYHVEFPHEDGPNRKGETT